MLPPMRRFMWHNNVEDPIGLEALSFLEITVDLIIVQIQAGRISPKGIPAALQATYQWLLSLQENTANGDAILILSSSIGDRSRYPPCAAHNLPIRINWPGREWGRAPSPASTSAIRPTPLPLVQRLPPISDICYILKLIAISRRCGNLNLR
jgi:hypothetical protein